MCIKFGPTNCKPVGHARTYNEPRRYNMETNRNSLIYEWIWKTRFESHGLWGWQGHIIVVWAFEMKKWSKSTWMSISMCKVARQSPCGPPPLHALCYISRMHKNHIGRYLSESVLFDYYSYLCVFQINVYTSFIFDFYSTPYFISIYFFLITSLIYYISFQKN